MKAAEHLQIAENYLREAQKCPSDPYSAMMHIHQLTSLAGDHIDKAVALDPTATIEVQGRTVGADFLISDSLRMQGMIETKHGPKKSDVRRGIGAIEKALKYRPNDPDLHISLALGRMRLNDRSGAQPHLDKAIELDPTNMYAHELKDGAKGVMDAERHGGLQFLIDVALDFKLWAMVIPAGWWIYCGYRYVQAIANNEVSEDAGFYLVWFFGMAAVVAAFTWVKEKLAS
jgi:tetratricopeptide (TPR) repeat protein